MKEEQVRVKATTYGHSFAILVPMRIIPDHERDDVLEVTVTLTNAPKTEYRLYTTHLPGYKRAYLDLYQLQPQKDEEFVIKSVRIYSFKEFYSDYDAAKPQGFENTTLLLREGEPVIKIDSSEAELVGASLRTYQGMVVLDAVIKGFGPVKFQKMVGGFEVRMKDHSPVTSMRADDSGLSLTYHRTFHDDHQHVRGSRVECG